MSRLTNDRLADIIREDSYIEMDMHDLKKIKQPSMEELYEKLNRYEKIEEELGCPLDFVIIPYFMSGIKKIWYHKKWCEVIRIVAYEAATRPYMEIRCDGYKYLKMVFLNDYKKTWWLREDRSE